MHVKQNKKIISSPSKTSDDCDRLASKPLTGLQ